jgi:hypothetical protein
VKPLTDKELNDLFRKHVPRDQGFGASGIDHRSEFVGSPFYAFARELEHRALAAGMLMGTMEGRRSKEASATSAEKRKTTLLGAIGSFFAWLLG